MPRSRCGASSAPAARRSPRCAGCSAFSARGIPARWCRSRAWATSRPLLADARSAGISADLLVDGEPAPVSPALDLCAYRIVQEALTNAIKHAAPARASVNVRWRDGELELEVSDDGAPARRRQRRGWRTGIRACASAWRSTAEAFQAGARPDGGFTVLARLPLTQAEPVLSDVRDRLARRRPPTRGRDPGARGDRRDRADVLAHALASPTRIGRSPPWRPFCSRRRSPCVASGRPSRWCSRWRWSPISMPFGSQLLSNDNAYVIPVLVLSYSAGAWLDHAAERGRAWSGTGAALGLGAPAGTGRIDDRARTDRLGALLRHGAVAPHLARRPPRARGTAPGPAHFVNLRRRPPPPRTRTTRRRSLMSARASAQSCRTSSPTASARW